MLNPRKDFFGASRICLPPRFPQPRSSGRTLRRRGILLRQLILRAGFAGGGAEVELDHDIIADEVIGLAGEVDGEIFPVDREFCLYRHAGFGDLDFRGEGDAVGDAVQREVAGDFVRAFGGGFNGGDGEGGGGELFRVEEVRALQVAGQSFVVGPGGGHGDLDLGGRDHLSTCDADCAGEVRETAVMAARHLGANKSDLGFRADDEGLAGCGRGAGVLRRGRVGLVNLVGGIGASGEEAGGDDGGNGDEMGLFHACQYRCE